MKVTLLGTGTSTGVPQIGCNCEVCRSLDPHDNRLRASILVENGPDHILIDCGPDFRTQMLRAAIPAPTALLITHEHYDHVGGIDDLRPFCARTAFPIYAEARVLDALKRHNEYMFSAVKYPGVPNLDLHAVDPVSVASFTVGQTTVVPIRAYHFKLPVLGFRIGPMAYLTDLSALPEEELAKLQGLELLIIDALRREPHMSHFSLDEAMALARRINARRTLFTHMSHHMGLHAIVNAILPDGYDLAYDGEVVKL